MLRHLGKNGLPHARFEGHTYIYRPNESAHLMAARAVRQIIDRQIIDRFCRASLDQLVSGIVDGKMFSENELGKRRDFVSAKKIAKAAGE